MKQPGSATLLPAAPEVSAGERVDPSNPSAGQRRQTLLGWLRIAVVVAALAVSGLAWVVASPLGGAADDTYHLTSIWCRTAGVASACETRYMINGTPVVKTHAAFATVCFAGHPTESAACQEINTDQAFTGRIDTGGYPGPYYQVMHVFASDHIVDSALLIRAINFGLFLVTIALTFWLASPSVRRSMVATLAVTLVPVGLYFIASSNPSSWAITGIAVEFFALLALGEATSRWRPLVLSALAVFGAALAATARGDAGAYAIAVAGIGGWMIWPSLRRHWWRAIALVPVVLVGCYSYFGSRQTTQGYGADTPLGFEASIYNLLDILVITFGNLGLGRMGSLGSLDVPMPAATWALMALAAGAIIVAGMSAANLRSGLAAAGTATLLIVLPWYMLQKYGFVVGEFVQPRYLLPLFIVLVGVLTLGVAGVKTALLSTRQTLVVATFITIAQSAALYATLQRFTNATKTDSLGQNVQWWWQLPIGPVSVWVFGTFAFGVAIFLLFTWVVAPTSLGVATRFTAPAWLSRVKGVRK